MRRSYQRSPTPQLSDIIVHEQRLDHVGDANARDRMGWSALDLLPPDSVVLDVNNTDIAAAAGSVVTPHVGPALDEIGGASTSGAGTPWVDWTGAGVLEARFGSGQSIRTATHVDPALTDHVIGVALVEARGQGTRQFAATRPSGGGRGFWFYTSSSGGTYVRVEGDSVVTCGSANSGWGRQLASFTIARGGNITVYANGQLLDTDACPAGSLAGGSGIAVAGYPTSGLGLLHVVRVVLAFGPTLDAIGTLDFHQYLAECVLGYLPSKRYGTARSTYSRATLRTYQPTGADPVYLLSAACPPFGGGEAGSDGAIETVTSKNILPKAGENATYLVDADAGLTVAADPVDDSAAIDPVVPGASGVAFQVANPTGGELFLRLPNAIGGAAPVASWLSIRLRKAVDTGAVRLGWMTAAGAFTQVLADCNDNYARTTGTGTPNAVTDKLALGLPAGSTTYFVLYAAGLGQVVPPDDPVSQTAVGADGTGSQGNLLTGVDPHDPAGAVELALTPDGWSGETAAAPVGISALTVGSSELLIVDPRVNEASIYDSTFAERATAITALSDGVEALIRGAWTYDRCHVGQVGQYDSQGDYSGALAGSGLVLRGGPWRRSRLRLLRNPARGATRLPTLAPRGPARLALPAHLYAVTGVALELVKSSLTTLPPGAFVWSAETALAVTDTGPILELATPTAGDYPLTLRLTAGGSTAEAKSTTVHVRDDLGGADPTWDVVWAGDSITLQTGPQTLVTLGGGHIVARGTQSAVGPTPCEAYGGKRWRWFACDRGAPAGSPWLDADDLIDIPAYLATLGLTPDAVVIMLGTTDVFGVSVLGIDTAVQRVFEYVDRLLAAWTAAAPGALVGIATQTPGSTDQADFDASYPPAGTVLVGDWRERQHRLVEGLMERYGDQIVPVHCHVDGAVDYGGGNALHPLPSGDQAIAGAIFAWLVHAMT